MDGHRPRHRMLPRLIITVALVAIVLAMVYVFSATTFRELVALNDRFAITVFGRKFGGSVFIEWLLFLVCAFFVGFLIVLIVEGAFRSRHLGIFVMFARFSSLGLIIFLWMVLGLRASVGNAGMLTIANGFWIGMAIYTALQMLDAITRPPVNLWAFFTDFVLDLIAFLIALMFFVLRWANDTFASYRHEEVWIYLQALSYTAIMLTMGVLIMVRIGFAGKEREEYERGRG